MSKINMSRNKPSEDHTPENSISRDSTPGKSTPENSTYSSSLSSPGDDFFKDAWNTSDWNLTDGEPKLWTGGEEYPYKDAYMMEEPDWAKTPLDLGTDAWPMPWEDTGLHPKEDEQASFDQHGVDSHADGLSGEHSLAPLFAKTGGVIKFFQDTSEETVGADGNNDSLTKVSRAEDQVEVEAMLQDAADQSEQFHLVEVDLVAGYETPEQEVSPAEGIEFHESTPQPSFPAQVPATDRKEIRGLDRSTKAARKTQRGLVNATPAWVAAEILQISLTAEERMTYFPKHNRRPGYLSTLYSNGWTHDAIATTVNHARGITAATGMKYQSITKVSSNMGLKYTDLLKGEKINDQKIAASTTKRETSDYLLSDLADGIINHPTGYGSGPLTKCILYALQHPEQTWSLYDVPTLMAEQKFLPLESYGLANITDDAAFNRFKAQKAASGSTVRASITAKKSVGKKRKVVSAKNGSAKRRKTKRQEPDDEDDGEVSAEDSDFMYDQEDED